MFAKGKLPNYISIFINFQDNVIEQGLVRNPSINNGIVNKKESLPIFHNFLFWIIIANRVALPLKVGMGPCHPLGPVAPVLCELKLVKVKDNFAILIEFQ